MLYYTVGQWYALAYMALCGVIMGAIYELFKIARQLTAAGRAFGAVLDATMCILLAVLMALMLMRANGGDVRLYAFIGCGAGMAIFCAGPARIMRAAAGRILCRLNKCRRHIENISFFRHILK